MLFKILLIIVLLFVTFHFYFDAINNWNLGRIVREGLTGNECKPGCEKPTTITGNCNHNYYFDTNIVKNDVYDTYVSQSNSYVQSQVKDGNGVVITTKPNNDRHDFYIFKKTTTINEKIEKDNIYKLSFDLTLLEGYDKLDNLNFKIYCYHYTGWGGINIFDSNTKQLPQNLEKNKTTQVIIDFVGPAEAATKNLDNINFKFWHNNFSGSNVACKLKLSNIKLTKKAKETMCPYVCKNFDFDSTKCNYDQDCESCGYVPVTESSTTADNAGSATDTSQDAASSQDATQQQVQITYGDVNKVKNKNNDDYYIGLSMSLPSKIMNKMLNVLNVPHDNQFRELTNGERLNYASDTVTQTLNKPAGMFADMSNPNDDGIMDFDSNYQNYETVKPGNPGTTYTKDYKLKDPKSMPQYFDSVWKM